MASQDAQALVAAGYWVEPVERLPGHGEVRRGRRQRGRLGPAVDRFEAGPPAEGPFGGDAHWAVGLDRRDRVSGVEEGGGQKAGAAAEINHARPGGEPGLGRDPLDDRGRVARPVVGVGTGTLGKTSRRIEVHGANRRPRNSTFPSPSTGAGPTAPPSCTGASGRGKGNVPCSGSASRSSASARVETL